MNFYHPIGSIKNFDIDSSDIVIVVPSDTSEDGRLGNWHSIGFLGSRDTDEWCTIGIINSKSKLRRNTFIDYAIAEIGVGCPNLECIVGNYSWLATEVPCPRPRCATRYWSHDLEIRTLNLEINLGNILPALRWTSVVVIGRALERHTVIRVSREWTRGAY